MKFPATFTQKSLILLHAYLTFAHEFSELSNFLEGNNIKFASIINSSFPLENEIFARKDIFTRTLSLSEWLETKDGAWKIARSYHILGKVVTKLKNRGHREIKLILEEDFEAIVRKVDAVPRWSRMEF